MNSLILLGIEFGFQIQENYIVDYLQLESGEILLNEDVYLNDLGIHKNDFMLVSYRISSRQIRFQATTFLCPCFCEL